MTTMNNIDVPSVCQHVKQMEYTVCVARSRGTGYLHVT